VDESRLAGLELDKEGNIVTRPVLGWTTAPVGGKSLQAILTPHQALELAETLTKQAWRILDAPKPVDPAH
jgi:hypothetical protein